ncbi:NAD(P)H-quinone oxidoreductase subunit 1 [Nymphaea thermarum]|nr:NAD(P)H-quinone oxidoreductase subunit 1 [Nymphaea thermarum]
MTIFGDSTSLPATSDTVEEEWRKKRNRLIISSSCNGFFISPCSKKQKCYTLFYGGRGDFGVANLLTPYIPITKLSRINKASDWKKNSLLITLAKACLSLFIPVSTRWTLSRLTMATTFGNPRRRPVVSGGSRRLRGKPVGVKKPDARAILPRLSLFSLVFLLVVSRANAEKKKWRTVWWATVGGAAAMATAVTTAAALW